MYIVLQSVYTGKSVLRKYWSDSMNSQSYFLRKRPTRVKKIILAFSHIFSCGITPFRIVPPIW